MLKATLTLLAFLTLFSNSYAAENKHIFIATDESRKQLLYVNEFEPEKDWTITVGPNRDLQLIDDKNVIMNIPDGYRQYEVATGKLVKEVKVGKGIKSLVRTQDGHTLLASGNKIWELDAKDKVIKEIDVKMGGYFRQLRLAKNGNFLFTGSITSMKEADRTGKILREIDLTKIAPKVKKPYFMVQQPDGNFMISTGYDASLLIVDKDNKLIRKIGGRDAMPEAKLNFFGGAEVLPNGNILVTNWTGHGAKDSEKGPQVLEFDKEGKIVWKWHDPKRAGSLHGIAVIK